MNNTKEDISMPEALAMINESLTKIQQQINRLEQKVDDLSHKLDSEISALRQEMNERFAAVDQRLDYHETWLNRIEKNMATKVQLNSLLKVLERKDVISKYEVHHIVGSESES